MTVTLDRPVVSDTLTDVTVNQTDLLDALKFASASLSKRPVMPSLAGVKLTAANGVLNVAAFDYEQSTCQSVDCEGSGTLLVGGKLLLDVVKTLDKGITLHLDTSKDGALLLNAGGSVFTIPSIPLDDYPALLVFPSPTIAVMTGKVLSKLAKVTIAAAGNDSGIPILTAVRVEVSDGQIETICTDRYRLALASVNVGTYRNVTGQVNAKAFAWIAKAFAKEDAVFLSFGDGIFFAQAGQREITVRMTEGEFPQFRNLLASVDAQGTMTVDVKSLTKAVKTAQTVLNKNAPVITVPTDDGMNVDGGNVDEATVSTRVAAQTTGLVEGKRGFNPYYLLDGMTMLGGSEVRFALNAPTKPTMLTNPNDDSLSYLLMPFRLSAV